MPNIDPDSVKPRFSARTSPGQYINPATGQVGTRPELGHLDVNLNE